MKAMSTGPQMLSSAGFNGFYPTSSTSPLLSSPADYAALGIQGPPTKQQKLALKASQHSKQISDYRRRIKDLKCDMALKDTEIQNL